MFYMVMDAMGLFLAVGETRDSAWEAYCNDDTLFWHDYDPKTVKVVSLRYR